MTHRIHEVEHYDDFAIAHLICISYKNERYYSWVLGWRPPLLVGTQYNAHPGLTAATGNPIADRMHKFNLSHGWHWVGEWAIAQSASKDGWTYSATPNGVFVGVCP